MKKKGNITILVLFLLVACSLLGVLTIHYVNQMFGQSRSLGDSLQAWYHAQAGKEYALSMLPFHGPGFQFHTSSDIRVVDVVGRSHLLSAGTWQSSGCVEPFVISSGQSLIVPLFLDDGQWPQHWTNASQALPSLSFLFPQDEHPLLGEVSAALLVVSGEVLHPDGVFVRTGIMNASFFSDFSSGFIAYVQRMGGSEVGGDFRLLSWNFADYAYKNFLILANRSAQELRFCLSSPIPLATDRFWIASKGIAGQEIMAVDAFSDQPIPHFTLSSLVE